MEHYLLTIINYSQIKTDSHVLRPSSGSVLLQGAALYFGSACAGGNASEQTKKEGSRSFGRDRGQTNMAEGENVNSRQSVCEGLVNRWAMDYYFHLTVELFQKHKHADFENVVNLISCK